MRIPSKLAALVLAGTLVACTTAPIRNVTDAPVTNAAGKTLTPDQVKSAIIRAGATLGWQMKEAGPGMLVGSLALRTHTAEIQIPYSSSSYSITLKSSTNLDQKGDQIHKNYNGWIQNLTNGINAQLAAS